MFHSIVASLSLLTQRRIVHRLRVTPHTSRSQVTLAIKWTGTPSGRGDRVASLHTPRFDNSVDEVSMNWLIDAASTPTPSLLESVNSTEQNSFGRQQSTRVSFVFLIHHLMR